MKHTITFFIFLCSLFVLLAGCGNHQKLGGQVVFPDDEPLKTGIIYFSKSDFLARAFIKQDGTYDVGSLAAKDGLPPGTYKVFISGAMEAIEIEQKSNTPTKVNEMGESASVYTEGFKPLIAQKYTSEQTTPLSITIPGEKTFKITVERP